MSERGWCLETDVARGSKLMEAPAAAACVLGAALLVASVAQAGAESIVAIRVHGNHATPDAEILALAGLAVGGSASDQALAAAGDRLRASGRFASVDVRKRFHSIEDPSRILVLLLVQERPGATPADPVPGPLSRFLAATMWLPVLRYDEGYGLTYGARVSVVDPLGDASGLSVPLTWGGERRVGIEASRVFARRPAQPWMAGARRALRVTGEGLATRRVNPHFAVSDVRRQARFGIEQSVTPSVRVGAAVRAASVTFGGLDENHAGAGLDLTVDTRLDPTFPRNAIHARVGWERLSVGGRAIGLASADLRGYLGLVGAMVFAVRGVLECATAPLPPSEQRLLGGSASLRGHPVGYRAGDQLAAVSGELRVPLTSPLGVGRAGLRAFVDAGTVWSATDSLRGQRLDRGIGAGAFFGVAMANISLDIAWPEAGRLRWHAGLGVSF
jgi:outer membrane protein assembly factor BamA